MNIFSVCPYRKTHIPTYQIGQASQLNIIPGVTSACRLVESPCYIHLGKFDHDLTVLPSPGIMVRLRGIIPFYGRKIQGSDILFHVPRSMRSDGISMGFQWDFNGIWLNYNDRTLFSLTGIMVRLRGIIPFYGRKFQVSELLISDTQMGSY